MATQQRALPNTQSQPDRGVGRHRPTPDDVAPQPDPWGHAGVVELRPLPATIREVSPLEAAVAVAAAQPYVLDDQTRTDEVGRAPRRLRWPACVLAAMLLFLTFQSLLDKTVGYTGTWVIYLAFAAIGLVSLAFACRRGAWVAAIALLPWVAWAATWPTWSAWSPDSRGVAQEQSSLLACALLTLSAVVVAGGSRTGARAHRAAWLAVGVACVPIGLWEVTTQQHLGAGPWMPPPWSAAATFANPNNFAAVLLVVYGLAMLRLTERHSIFDRLLTTLLALACAGLMVATLSRLAVAAALGLTVAAALFEVRRRTSGRVRDRRHRTRTRTVAAVFVAAAAGAAVAAFTVPSLVRLNPLAAFLFPGDDSTARADGLRVSLVRRGLDMWSQNRWFGVGGARFEVLLQQEGFEHVMPMHNGFVEVLTEYGLVVAIPLAAWILALTWCMLAPARRPFAGDEQVTASGRPRTFDDRGARFAIGVWLLGFVVVGLVTSSPLTWPMWYLMLASATACAWWLRSSSRHLRRPRHH